MWFVNEHGKKVFTSGKEAWSLAAAIAALCPAFTADDEDEMIAEEPISCYNCRYRRWTVNSFTCCRPA